MQIFRIQNEIDFRNLDKSTEIFNHGCVLALGFFDGLHTAHRKLISEARNLAIKNALPLIIFTFSAKSTTFKPTHKRLLTDDEKICELDSLGADAVLVFDFELIKSTEPRAFVEEILVNKLNTHTAFCGFNFRFGKNATGDAALLKSQMNIYGRDVAIIPELQMDGSEVSSSVIRALLLEKKLKAAARLLDKPFFADGKVSHGLGIGKKIGSPTVNVELDTEKLTLPNGVYLTVIKIGDSLYPSVTNLGVCPTFDEREVHAESFIFDFCQDIYSENVRLYFIEFLRDEIKFSSKEELIMQINIDKNKALELSKEIKWQEIGLN